MSENKPSQAIPSHPKPSQAIPSHPKEEQSEIKYGEGIIKEELKLRVASDYFSKFNCQKRKENIDFWVSPKGQVAFNEISDEQPVLWAEAKRGRKPIEDAFIQLILTIGKHRVYGKCPPPNFLGAFNAEKIAFLPYADVMSVFSQNDFNWNVTPSNHKTKEFIQLKSMIGTVFEKKKLIFNYKTEDSQLREFIQNNFGKIKAGEISRIEVNINNVVFVFNRWLESVCKTISISDETWNKLKKDGIQTADFFLADLISQNNKTIKDDLHVLLAENEYEIITGKDSYGLEQKSSVGFKDGQKAHRTFWEKYKRPPKNKDCREILDRRDLIVPQDFRERTGAFFTPAIWVEKSQQYIAEVLGEDWQDEYYIWDCCAGTGNLLNGLKDRYRIWASTIDESDVRIMKDRISEGHANLIESHVFQFDFLNDDFDSDKVPQSLKNVLFDEEKRKKLVLYINPPYAEATNARTVTRTGQNKSKVSTDNRMNSIYKGLIGKASNEVFALFLIRIYKEIQCCKIANFAKLKALCAPSFAQFRKEYQPKLEKLFIVPSKSFNNNKGDFPIGFHIWDADKKEKFNEINSSVYSINGDFWRFKKIKSCDKTINKWIKENDNEISGIIGYMENPTTDFQNNKFLCITNNKGTRHNNYSAINEVTILLNALYLSVRHCITATWLNDRDQFLYPNDSWKTDKEFQTDCLAYTLFHDQNRISSNHGINHWIPFREEEVNAQDNFQSHFMSDYIKDNKLVFSQEAQKVFAAGRELWKYYHAQKGINPNASLFDIRMYFQGQKGKEMKDIRGCTNTEYVRLKYTLRDALKVLAQKIEPKVYEHGFLVR